MAGFSEQSGLYNFFIHTEQTSLGMLQQLVPDICKFKLSSQGNRGMVVGRPGTTPRQDDAAQPLPHAESTTSATAKPSRYSFVKDSLKRGQIKVL